MSDIAYKLGKLLSTHGGKWIALLLLLSVALNVKLWSDIGNARKEAEEQKRRLIVTTEGLYSTAHLAYLSKRTAVADSCMIDVLEKQRKWPPSEELKRVMEERRTSEENAGIECQQQGPERSEDETARLVDEKIQEEMRKMK